MDRIHRRQISAGSFLRPEKFFILHKINSDSVRFGQIERRKCHESNIRDIHSTTSGNLFLLVHGIGGFSSFYIIILSCSSPLFKRESNPEGGDWRGKYSQRSKRTSNPPVNAAFKKRGSNLGGDWWVVVRGEFDWHKLRTSYPFHGFHVGGGNCGISLKFLVGIKKLVEMKMDWIIGWNW